MSRTNGTSARIWDALDGRTATAPELAKELGLDRAVVACLAKQMADRGVLERVGQRESHHNRPATLYARGNLAPGRPKHYATGTPLTLEQLAIRDALFERSQVQAADRSAPKPTGLPETVEQFLARGGRIDVLPGFNPVPPARRPVREVYRGRGGL